MEIKQLLEMVELSVAIGKKSKEENETLKQLRRTMYSRYEFVVAEITACEEDAKANNTSLKFNEKYLYLKEEYQFYQSLDHTLEFL